MHLQSALFTSPARITASVPQFALNIANRFRELLNFQFLLFYFLSLSVDFAPRVLLTESFVSRRQPIINGSLNPVGYWNDPNMARLANKINDGRMVFAPLEVVKG